ncbi:MAG: hypothetical protein IJU82_00455 [Ruminiclostridium sp.]|nr:hypothetical protein [Ruminiclostridium sp.]
MAHTAKTEKILNLFGSSEAAPAAMNPAIKPPEKEAVPAVFLKSDNGTQFVNLSFLLLNEQLGGIMERFNCCTCDKCVAAVTEESLKQLPATIVRVKRKSDAKLVDKAAADERSEAIRIITKAVMFVKSNPRH